MIRVGLLALVVALMVSACSSVSPPAEVPQPLGKETCLRASVQGPNTVVEGEGLTAQLTVSNICDDAIQIPIANATAISNGEDTGVEISFHLTITDPEIRTADISQGHRVRWNSVEPNPSYDLTQKMVTLAPGDELVRDISWNGLLRSGKVLPNGNYVLFGEFYYTPNGITDRDFAVIQGTQTFKIVPN